MFIIWIWSEQAGFESTRRLSEGHGTAHSYKYRRLWWIRDDSALGARRWRCLQMEWRMRRSPAPRQHQKEPPVRLESSLHWPPRWNAVFSPRCPTSTATLSPTPWTWTPSRWARATFRVPECVFTTLFWCKETTRKEDMRRRKPVWLVAGFGLGISWPRIGVNMRKDTYSVTYWPLCNFMINSKYMWSRRGF